MGDVHGAAKALQQCLDLVNFDYENDELVQVGDVADGWHEVYECVEILCKIKNLICIQGNHDYWTLQWMKSGFTPTAHRGQGGQATIDSYYRHGGVPDKHIRFFENQPLFYVDDQNRLFTHGGFSMRHTVYEGGVDLHNFSWNRELWTQALELREYGVLKLKCPDAFQEIYIGHTSTLQYEDANGDQIMYPIRACNVTNMDTGAGYSGRLSIMDIDTQEIWQSDCVPDLYPGLVGRKVFKKRKKK